MSTEDGDLSIGDIKRPMSIIIPNPPTFIFQINFQNLKKKINFWGLGIGIGILDNVYWSLDSKYPVSKHLFSKFNFSQNLNELCII